MSVEQRVARLERGVSGLLQRLEGTPTDALYRAPANGEWPVISILAHVVEMLPYWAHQAQAIASAPGRPFGRTHDDPGRIGAVEQHGSDAADVISSALKDSLAEAVAALRALPPDALDLTGQHPRRGSMQVRAVIDTFMVEHVEEHAAQVDAALAALG